jgi:hypothetical protein
VEIGKPLRIVIAEPEAPAIPPPQRVEPEQPKREQEKTPEKVPVPA